MNVASTKARIKNIADKTGKNYQDLLTAYGLERTIYRLSISEYKDRFILKGGIFLYAISGGDYARATTDIDFLAQNISNNLKDMGHSDIGVTMNVYTHLGLEDAEEELRKMEDFRRAQEAIEKKEEKPITQKAFKVV